TTIAAVAGRVPMGALADRMDRRLIAGANFLLQVAGVACLLAASSTIPLYTGCALFGLGLGNVITLPGLLVERESPRRQFAPLAALATGSSQLAFAFARARIGLLRDATGAYAPALGLCGGADLLAAVIVLAGRAGGLAPRRSAADPAAAA